MFIDDHYIRDGEKLVIFQYVTRHLSNTAKVKFYYALKGRDGKSGVVKTLRLVQLGKGVLLAPFRSIDEVEGFFKVWNVSFTKRHAIVGKVEFGGGHY